jgi:hypothetical protein
MKYELSLETMQTMKSPVAKVAVSVVGAAALVLVFQILQAHLPLGTLVEQSQHNLHLPQSICLVHASDLPGRAEAMVAFHLIDRRARPSSKEGQM